MDTELKSDGGEPENVQVDGGEGSKIAFQRYQPVKPGAWKEITFSFGAIVPVTGKEPVINDLVGCYEMNRWPHGTALIINNEKFEGAERDGTGKDERNLIMLFRYLGYIVDVHRDCTADKIREVVKELQSRHHSKFDSFICCILSHGGKEGHIYGVDGVMVSLDDITRSFNGEQCAGLIGKPKLFFLQACRGDKTDKGVRIDGDEEEELHVMTDEGPRIATDSDYTIPSAADFCFSYATPDYHSALRDPDNGSWYISELCRCLAKHGRCHSLVNILTKVNGNVAYYECGQGLKQSPELTTRLRKDVLFFSSN